MHNMDMKSSLVCISEYIFKRKQQNDSNEQNIKERSTSESIEYLCKKKRTHISSLMLWWEGSRCKKSDGEAAHNKTII